MKKFLAILCLLIGLTGLGYGAYYAVNIYLDANSIVEYKNNKNTNSKVLVKGNLQTTSKAIDNELEVETDSAILIREVEMVQWYQDEKGTRLVLANYQIPSFTVNGAEYKNPKFYSTITNKEFYGTASINGLKVDDSVLQEIVEQINLDKINKVTLEELPNNLNKRYDLVVRNGEYVSAGDKWELGDVKISYYTIDQEDVDLAIVGNVSKNSLNIKDNGLVLTGNINKTEAINNLLMSAYPYAIIGGVGLIFVIIGLIALRKPKKTKKEEKVVQQ